MSFIGTDILNSGYGGKGKKIKNKKIKKKVYF
jgi:hypothetical protein